MAVVVAATAAVKVGLPIVKFILSLFRNKAADAAKGVGRGGIAARLATDAKRVEYLLEHLREAKLDAVVTLLKKGAAMHGLALDYERSGNPDLDKTRRDAHDDFREARSKAIEAFHEFQGHPAKQVKCIKLELVAQIYLHHRSAERFQLEAQECVARLFQEREVQRMLTEIRSTSGIAGIRALLPFAYRRLTPDVLAHLGSSPQPRYLVWKRTKVTEFAEALSQAIETVNNLLRDQGIRAMEIPALDEATTSRIPALCGL